MTCHFSPATRAAVCALGIFLTARVPLRAQDATLAPQPNPRRASIVLIVADGLGYGDLGCYGQQRIKTPNLDRMAAEGVRFTSFYAGSSATATAQAALLLGRDSGHLGIHDDGAVALPLGAPTTAEILKETGYHTGCIGEWGLGGEGSVNVPQQRGFDEWVGQLTGAEAQTDFPEYLWRHDPADDGNPGYTGKLTFPQNANGAKSRSASDLFTTAAMNFIRINKPDKFNRQRPFFLQLNYALPRVNNLDSAEPYELEPWPRAEKFKAAAIARLDANVGKILERLKETGQENNTIVFVTSAAGPRGGDGVDTKFHHSAGLLSDGALGEAGIRVPLIVWSPSKIKAGEENYQPCAAWDILPTFAEIARAVTPERADGFSFWQPLQGRPQPRRHEFLYWELHTNGLPCAVRMGDWKAIRLKPGQPLKLYSLTADRAEKIDIAAKQPEIIARMEAYLKTGRSETAGK